MGCCKFNRIFVLSLGLSISFFFSCASTPKKSAASSVSKSKDRSSASKSDYVSSRRTTVLTSLSNNSLTSKTYSSNKAKSFASDISSNSKDPKVLAGKVAAMRLARAPISSVMQVAKAVARQEMKKSPDKSVDNYVKFDLALAAINNKKFALAEYFLKDLLKSRNPALKAGAHNALGVIDVKNGRYPEAVFSFKNALKANRSYKPALMNLGFLALHGGDMNTAKRSLASMQNDWFVQSGLISIARYEGNNNRVESLCRSVLEKKPQHKPTLYNCALHYLQAKQNFARAKELATKMVKAPGGSSRWGDKGYRLLSKIEVQRARAKSAQPAAVKSPKDK